MGKIIKHPIKNRDGRGFLQIDNALIWNEIEPRLSLDEYSVLTKCFSYSEEWELNWFEFQKRHGISKRRRTRALEGLKKKGYCIEEVHRIGRKWFHVYHFFEKALSEKEQEDFILSVNKKSNSQNKISELRPPNRDFSNTLGINNNIFNNNLKNNNKNNNLNNKKENISFSSEENLYTKDNTCNHDTCLHDSLNELTFSDENNNHDNMAENSGSFTNLNNPQQAVSTSVVRKSTRTHKGTLDGEPCKNAVQIRDNQPKVSVREVLEGTDAIQMGEQTEEDKKQAHLQTENNHLKGQLRDIKEKEGKKSGIQKRKDKIIELIKKDFPNVEVAKMFEAYIEDRFENNKPVSKGAYELLKDDLLNHSNGDVEKQKKIIRKSTIRGYMEFYALDEDKQQKIKSNNIIPSVPKSKGLERGADGKYHFK